MLYIYWPKVKINSGTPSIIVEIIRWNEIIKSQLQVSS